MTLGFDEKLYDLGKAIEGVGDLLASADLAVVDAEGLGCLMRILAAECVRVRECPDAPGAARAA